MVPDCIIISVWDQNPNEKDVHCGSVSIPFRLGDDPAQFSMYSQDFTLEKRCKSTGTVNISLTFEFDGSEEFSPRPRTRTESSVGGELDDLIDCVEGGRGGNKKR